MWDFSARIHGDYVPTDLHRVATRRRGWLPDEKPKDPPTVERRRFHGPSVLKRTNNGQGSDSGNGPMGVVLNASPQTAK